MYPETPSGLEQFKKQKKTKGFVEFFELCDSKISKNKKSLLSFLNFSSPQGWWERGRERERERGF